MFTIKIHFFEVWMVRWLRQEIEGWNIHGYEVKVEEVVRKFLVHIYEIALAFKIYEQIKGFARNVVCK